MSERTLVIDHLKFNYEGLFNAGELYNLIANFFYEKGWDWNEKLNQEQVTPDGKQIRLILEPWKTISDFNKIIINLKIHMINIKDVEVQQDGEDLRLNQGAINITFDGYVLADRNGEWTGRPFYWFISILARKYFFRDHYKKMERWLEADVEDLHGRIKNFLNVYQYTYQRPADV